MKIKMAVSGLEKVNHLLAALAADSDDAVGDVVKAIAEKTKAVAQENMVASAEAAAPGSYPHRQSGKLAASIRVDVTNGATTIASVGTPQIHGYYLEFGTESMEARPWLRPSFEQAAKEAQAMLEARMSERV